MSAHIATVLGGHRVVPVVVLEDETIGRPLADTLTAAGLGCAEVTLRTSAALPALREMSRVKDFVAGAGTVLTAPDAREAIDAGARFIVSPGLSPAVVAASQDAGIPVIPGIATATELMTALDLGVEIVKFFPAEANGGVQALQAIASVFPTVQVMPTGGITVANLPDYLQIPTVRAVGGTWITPREALTTPDFDTIARLAAQAVDIARTVG